MKPRPLLIAVAALAAAATGCNSAKQPIATASPINAPRTSYLGVIPTDIKDRPQFQLTDTFGKGYDFQKQTAGKPTLVYFGYTRCPDECPTTLHDIHAALRSVSPDVRKKIVVIFVTTDPTRDTPTVLSHWLQDFDSTFIGLTGTPAQIAQAERVVGVPVAVADQKDQLPNNNGYSVNHAAVVVAYDATNRSPVLYPSGTSVDTYVSDLPLLAKES